MAEALDVSRLPGTHGIGAFSAHGVPGIDGRDGSEGAIDSHRPFAGVEQEHRRIAGHFPRSYYLDRVQQFVADRSHQVPVGFACGDLDLQKSVDARDRDIRETRTRTSTVGSLLAEWLDRTCELLAEVVSSAASAIRAATANPVTISAPTINSRVVFLTARSPSLRETGMGR